MKQVSLSGSPRENVGKKDAGSLRREGKIPCILYGGKEQVSFTIVEQQLNKIVFSPDVYQVNLDLNGNVVRAILKDAQFHPVTDKVMHADFIELVAGKAIRVALPLHVEGNSPGVARGGTKVVHFRKITVMGAPENLPEQIVCDISKLDIGDKIRVADLNQGVLQVLEAPSAVVVAITESRASRKAAETAAPGKK